MGKRLTFESVSTHYIGGWAVYCPGTKPLEWQNALAQVSTSGVHFRVGRGLEAEAGSELLGSSWTLL